MGKQKELNSEANIKIKFSVRTKLNLFRISKSFKNYNDTIEYLLNLEEGFK